MSSNDTELAHEAIRLMINNDWVACEQILLKNKENSSILNFCYAFFVYTKSILIFEENALKQASKILEETQKNLSNTYKKLSSKSQPKASNASMKTVGDIEEEKIRLKILIADCKLYTAMLTVVRQDFIAIAATGTFELRRAWKTYSQLEKQLFELFKKLDPNAEIIYGSDASKVPEFKLDDNDAAQDLGDNMLDLNLEATNMQAVESELSVNAVKSLLAMVSFGFGVVQLLFSFLPPKVLSLLKFIGFEGDRSVALKSIYFTSVSDAILAPFADIMLLFYSTLGRQIFGDSEYENYLNEPELNRIFEKNLKKYENSSMFLFCKGKFHQLVEKNLTSAYEFFLETQKNAEKIPEFKSLTWYELGLVNVMRLQFDKALECFTNFGATSKWSVSLNFLLQAILNGVLGNMDKVNQLCKEASKAPQKKNPIENYSQRRLELIKKLNSKQKNLYHFLCIEFIYLWGFLPYTEKNCLNEMLNLLDGFNEKTLVSVKTLLEASIQMELDSLEYAEQLFNEALARDEKQSSLAKYVKPYTNIQLCLLYCKMNDLKQALAFLEKAKKYSDYDLEDRLQMQIRICGRKIECKKKEIKN